MVVVREPSAEEDWGRIRPKRNLRWILTVATIGFGMFCAKNLLEAPTPQRIVELSARLGVPPAVIFAVSWMTPLCFVIGLYYLWKNRRVPCKVFMFLGPATFTITGNPDRFANAKHPSMFWPMLSVSIIAVLLMCLWDPWKNSVPPNE